MDVCTTNRQILDNKRPILTASNAIGKEKVNKAVININKEKIQMNIRKRKSGFTLLEIIIVIIIIGVLASLALPRFYALIEASRVTEAKTVMATVRSAMIRYALRNGNSYAGVAADLSNLDTGDPSANSPNKNWDYTAAVSPTTFRITATRNTNNGGNGGTSWIEQNETTQTVTSGGTTPFVGGL